MEFWRHRKEHFQPRNARASSSALFDSDFENFMISLCEALYKLDEGAFRRAPATRCNRPKCAHWQSSSAEHLLNHATGESAFAANDILASTRAATEILKDRMWSMLRGAYDLDDGHKRFCNAMERPANDPTPYVVRGKAGLTISRGSPKRDRC